MHSKHSPCTRSISRRWRARSAHVDAYMLGRDALPGLPAVPTCQWRPHVATSVILIMGAPMLMTDCLCSLDSRGERVRRRNAERGGCRPPGRHRHRHRNR